MPSEFLDKVNTYYDDKKRYAELLARAWANAPSSDDTSKDSNSSRNTNTSDTTGSEAAIRNAEYEKSLQIQNMLEKLQAAKIEKPEEVKGKKKEKSSSGK